MEQKTEGVTIHKLAVLAALENLMVGYRGDKYEWKCLQIHYDRYLAGRRKIGSIPGTSSEVPKKVPAMVSTRTMSTVTAGGESSAGPSRSLRHHTVTPAHDLNKGAGSSVTLMQLPQEVLEHVLNFLPNSTIGLLRQVCRRMDVLCGGLLNLKFQGLQTRMLSRFQAIKGKMPRRESARRNHPLACESDIIETLHMRLTLLQMSFGKHIERKHCCFFAGEILDEVYRILHYIEVTPKLGRPYKVTDELFDLSTMAMEYFKEHIEPTLPEIAYFGSEFLGEYSSPFPAFEDTTPASISSSSKSEDTSISGPPQSNMVLRKRIRRIKQGMKRYNNQLSMLRRDLRACKGKIAEQQKQICDYSSRLDDCDKKNEETARKFSTLLQELNKCKTELQYWRSKAPANLPTCRGCGKPFVPAVNEDLAVLANQGVLPWEELIEPGPSNAGRADDESKPGCSKRKVEEAPTVNQEPKKPKKRVLKSRRK